MSNNPEIMAWFVGGLIAIILLGYCGYALFGDRARGEPRCPKCTHPFGNLAGTRCPECGHEAKSKRALLKPRRHWGRATIGFILLVAVALIVRVRSSGSDWLVLVPDHMLVWMVPLDGAQRDGPVVIELKRRLLFGGLSAGAASALISRLQEGDSSATPGSQSWDDRYGRLARAWGDRLVDRADPLIAELVITTPMLELSVPTAWPETSPVPASLSIDDYWPHGTEGLLVVRWSDGRELARVAFRNYTSAGRPYSFDLPPSIEWPDGTTVPLRIDLQTRRTTADWGGASVPPFDAVWGEWSEPQTVEVAASAPIHRELALESIGSPELDELVKQIFQPGLRRFTGSSRPFAIRFDPRAAADEATKGIVFGVVVEIVETTPGGEAFVRRRSQIWIHPGMASGFRSGWRISEEDLTGLAGAFDPTNRSIWTMRIRGDRGLAERAVAQSSGDPGAKVLYWSGLTEFLLPIHSERTTPFIRHWFFEDGPLKP
jgi:hypothetical protein